MRQLFLMILLLMAFGFAANVSAGEADVINVVMSQNTDGTFNLNVTVRHADTGWKHYANWFRVRTEDGRELGRRVLYHPHVPPK